MKTPKLEAIAALISHLLLKTKIKVEKLKSTHFYNLLCEKRKEFNAEFDGDKTMKK
jgi:hypothetical protein